MHHVPLHTHGGRRETHERANGLRGHRVGIELGDLLVRGVRLASTSRAMAAPQERRGSREHLNVFSRVYKYVCERSK